MSVKRRLIPLVSTFGFLLLCSLLLTLAYRAGGAGRDATQAASPTQESGEALQSALPQQGEMPLVEAVIAQAHWSGSDDPLQYPGAYILEVVVKAAPLDEGRFELHHGSALNPDRQRGPEKKNAMGEDCLRTRKCKGPVKQAMMDPKKQLLLYDYHEGTVFSVNDPSLELTLLSSQGGLDDQGRVVCRYRYRVEQSAMQRLEAQAGQERDVRLAYTGHISIYEENAWANVEHGSIVFSVPLPGRQKT